jgi:hypothetical protein
MSSKTSQRSKSTQPTIPAAESVSCSGLITKKEIAARYRVTIGCIDKWMAQKRIPYYKLSPRLVRFDPAACDAALKRYEIQSRW